MKSRETMPQEVAETINNTEVVSAPNDAEVLESPVAQSVLPYLTIKNLSEAEQANIIRQWSDTVENPNTRGETMFAWRKRVLSSFPDESEYETVNRDKKIMDANLLLDGLVIDFLGKAELDTDMKDTIAVVFLMNQRRKMVKYGLDGCLELLSISERSEYNLSKKILYQNIFEISDNNNKNVLLNTFKESDAIQRIKMIPMLSKVLKESQHDEERKEQALKKFLEDYSEYSPSADRNAVENLLRQEMKAETTTEKVNQTIDWLKNDENTTPLVKLVAERVGDDVEKDGTFEITRYYDKEAGIDYDMSYLLNTAHKPSIRPLIEDKLKINLDDISLNSQAQLLKYMTTANDDRFDSLCSTLNGLEPDLRLKLAEGFLAADFGADFGDALLEIAGSGNFKSEQVGEILDNIEGARKSIESITNLYKGFDGGEFAKEYTRATNERLTDAITVFSEIAKKGVARADLDWAGKITFDYDSAIEALQYETKSLEIISGTLSDVSSGVKGAFSEVVLRPDFERGRTLYDFYSPDHGHMLLYTRPEGSGKFDPTLEYGKVRSKYDIHSNNAGVEASISMIANPVDPFSLPNPFRPDRHKIKDSGYYDPATMNKVSAIRLDREGRAPGAPADDPDRDPINPIGMVSVDLAAIGDRADTPSGKIARLISTGNQLRAAQLGGDSSLNHNTRWFDQDKYGTSKGFSDLVGYIDTLATKWCKEYKPAASEGFTGAMRNANRGRGRKVLKKVV